MRDLEAETGISKSSVQRYLSLFRIQPHRTESFKLSTDPFFVDKTQAQEFLDAAKRQLAEAKSALEQAKCSLVPLLKAAGVEDPMLAFPLVETAQRKAELQNSISETSRSWSAVLTV